MVGFMAKTWWMSPDWWWVPTWMEKPRSPGTNQKKNPRLRRNPKMSKIYQCCQVVIWFHVTCKPCTNSMLARKMVPKEFNAAASCAMLRFWKRGNPALLLEDVQPYDLNQTTEALAPLSIASLLWNLQFGTLKRTRIGIICNLAEPKLEHIPKWDPEIPCFLNKPVPFNKRWAKSLGQTTCDGYGKDVKSSGYLRIPKQPWSALLLKKPLACRVWTKLCWKGINV